MMNLEEYSGLPMYLNDAENALIFGRDITSNGPETRLLKEMREVLFDPLIPLSDDTKLYIMYRGVMKEEDVELIELWGLRYDISIFFSEKLGKEYMKTLGHYHPYVCDKRLIAFPEVYEVIYGEALFLLQKTNNAWGDKGEVQIEDPIALIARQGQKAIMPPNYGHITINRTTEPLVLSNWVAAAFSSTYWSIKRHKGGAYYLIEGEDGKIVAEPNDCYANGNHRLPSLRWFEVKDRPQFGLTQGKQMYKAFLEEPRNFMFLRYPEQFAEALQPDNLFAPCTLP